MKIVKSFLLATIGLILAASINATPIQSDGTLTLTSKVIINSSIDAKVEDIQLTLSNSHDALSINSFLIIEFRKPEFTLSRTDDKQATNTTNPADIMTSTSQTIAMLNKRHEVGWRI